MSGAIGPLGALVVAVVVLAYKSGKYDCFWLVWETEFVRHLERDHAMLLLVGPNVPAHH